MCRIFAIAILSAVSVVAQPCAGLPPGKHALLERLTAQLTLTCEQQLKIEPMLHNEELVTKPLLKFSSLSSDDRQDIMQTIKLAARRKVRTVLTAEQQKGMDQEVESVSKGGNKGGGKKVVPDATPSLDVEETLSKAIIAYDALTPEEKKAMLLKVKRAARADASLQLTTDQQKSLDKQIADLTQ